MTILSFTMLMYNNGLDLTPFLFFLISSIPEGLEYNQMVMSNIENEIDQVERVLKQLIDLFGQIKPNEGLTQDQLAFFKELGDSLLSKNEIDEQMIKLGEFKSNEDSIQKIYSSIKEIRNDIDQTIKFVEKTKERYQKDLSQLEEGTMRTQQPQFRKGNMQNPLKPVKKLIVNTPEKKEIIVGIKNIVKTEGEVTIEFMKSFMGQINENQKTLRLKAEAEAYVPDFQFFFTSAMQSRIQPEAILKEIAENKKTDFFVFFCAPTLKHSINFKEELPGIAEKCFLIKFNKGASPIENRAIAMKIKLPKELENRSK